MSKTKHSITYRYDIDGHLVEVTRRHTGTAYARNGNVGNATEYFKWGVTVDGGRDLSGLLGCRTRADAYETARCHIRGLGPYENDDYRRSYRNVRSWVLVAEEMKGAYRGRTVQRNAREASPEQEESK